MNVKENFNQKLLVEGNDDQHVVWTLCNKFRVTESFDIIDNKGIENLYTNIPVRFKQSGTDTIGVIIDADETLGNRWRELNRILTSIGFILPDQFPREGLISKNEAGKTIGIWIMPNNEINGMLEDFMRFLIPAEDLLLPIVESTLQHIEEKGLSKYKPVHKSKATIHTWLAWQEEPGTPLGLSIKKKYLTITPAECTAFISWVNKLFNP
jgi:hypothetical protein